jgi:hypothetical protein
MNKNHDLTTLAAARWGGISLVGCVAMLFATAIVMMCAAIFFTVSPEERRHGGTKIYPGQIPGAAAARDNARLRASYEDVNGVQVASNVVAYASRNGVLVRTNVNGMQGASNVVAGEETVVTEPSTDQPTTDQPTTDQPTSDPRATGKSAEADSTGELSVAPAGELQYPEDRPAWIDASPALGGKVHRWPVTSSPSSTAELSRRALEVQLRAAAETYLETLLDDPEAPQVVALSDDWITARLNPDRSYEGTVQSGDEVLFEAAAELRFEPADRAWIQSQWNSHRVRQRMIGLGVISVGGTFLLLLSVAGLSLVARRAEQRVETAAR